MRSCLITLIVIVLGIVIYNMYRQFQQPVEEPQPPAEYAPQFRQEILDALTPMADLNPNIDFVNLDGSLLDLHYRTPVSQSQYREDASNFAIAFSRKRMEQSDKSEVVVRCIEGNLIRVEAYADNGRVTDVKEY